MSINVPDIFYIFSNKLIVISVFNLVIRFQVFS